MATLNQYPTPDPTSQYDWRPWSGPTRVPDKLNSKIATEARGLHDAWVEKQGNVSDLQRQDEAAKLHNNELCSQIDQAANRGDLDKARKLEDQRTAALTKFAPELWGKAIGAARAECHYAEQSYIQFLEANWQAFYVELTQDADEFYTEHAQAIEKAQAILEPYEAEHNERCNAIAQIVGRIPRFQPEDVPLRDYSKAPKISAERLATWERMNDPELIARRSRRFVDGMFSDDVREGEIDA
jgi:hypothetical protein